MCHITLAEFFLQFSHFPQQTWHEEGPIASISSCRKSPICCNNNNNNGLNYFHKQLSKVKRKIKIREKNLFPLKRHVEHEILVAAFIRDQFKNTSRLLVIWSTCRIQQPTPPLRYTDRLVAATQSSHLCTESSRISSFHFEMYKFVFVCWWSKLELCCVVERQHLLCNIFSVAFIAGSQCDLKCGSHGNKEQNARWN